MSLYLRPKWYPILLNCTILTPAKIKDAAYVGSRCVVCATMAGALAGMPERFTRSQESVDGSMFEREVLGRPSWRDGSKQDFVRSVHLGTSGGYCTRRSMIQHGKKQQSVGDIFSKLTFILRGLPSSMLSPRRPRYAAKVRWWGRAMLRDACSVFCRRYHYRL